MNLTEIKLINKEQFDTKEAHKTSNHEEIRSESLNNEEKCEKVDEKEKAYQNQLTQNGDTNRSIQGLKHNTGN